MTENVTTESDVERVAWNKCGSECGVAWDEYKRARLVARVAFERVQADYCRALHAFAKNEDAIASARSDYTHAQNAEWRAYNRVQNASWDNYDRRRDAYVSVWEELERVEARFESTRKAAWSEHERTRAEWERTRDLAWSEYERVRDAARLVYENAIASAMERYHRAVETAYGRDARAVVVAHREG